METTLDSAPPGSRVRISSILHHGGWVHRLYQLGVFPGVIVEVVHNEGRGPVVIRVNGSEVVLGKGLARRIVVEQLREETG
ncbi:FeoA family protein [Desulfurococcus mucosus]|uniref:FeoA family protein n=1 Tax=Desulfurococcus mucosus (strain ATCC 35584 / DSM 2162 / JCM 9187 / O7/1) TaxID=765177 RepID=E8R7N5_DESM0|nr:FeoA family protein [Desulfurococcus mucosus]ADV64530.1 FeoA family protein [Desulfurococcus mucosus DSM 2162]